MSLQSFFLPMWQGLKNWFIGEAVVVEASTHASERLQSKSNSDQSIAATEMVETRSGRHASPGATSAGGTPKNAGKSSGRRRSKPKESPSQPNKSDDGLDESQILETPTSPATGDTIIVETSGIPEESSQILPHRPRSLSGQDSEDSDKNTQATFSDKRQKEITPADENHPQDKGNHLDHDIASPYTVSNVPSSSSNANVDSTPQNVKLQRGQKRKRTKDDSVVTKKTKSSPTRHHKRFDSEEPSELTQHESIIPGASNVNPTIQGPVEKYVEQDDSDDDDDDDDAPEEVAASVGAQQARKVAAKTAQTIKSQEDAERAKRRKRDQELKSQAQASKKRKTKENDIPAANTSVTDSILASTMMDDGELPEELPDHLLAAETEYDLPRKTSKPTQQPNQRKRLDQDPKPATDLVVGNTAVRILSQTAVSLPPAIVRHTASIKERWLKVRREEAQRKLAGYRVKGAGARSFIRK